ncbi:hypothetical protein L3X38_036696 [Prunus dulcis]|uniref:Myb/SANT-like domain-containing protein n=1 Tax=Prunus dulcis TaxID=3755 RepID=A0AAD4YPZ9_PRUDU|nr:hypothetical protein L3X38_036696 [Prunus dulcis]
MRIKEVEAGNRPGTHFKKEGWENVRISLSKETGAEYDKSHLKNKWDALKEQWKIWKELIGKETDTGKYLKATGNREAGQPPVHSNRPGSLGNLGRTTVH